MTMTPREVRAGLDIISKLSQVTYLANSIEDGLYMNQSNDAVYGQAYTALQTAIWALLRGIDHENPDEAAEAWLNNILDGTSGDATVLDVKRQSPAQMIPTPIDWDTLTTEHES